jgi:hypothetical protein
VSPTTVSSIDHLVWSQTPVAASGSLAAGQLQFLTVTAYDAATAAAVFNATNCSSTKDISVVGCVAGQLLTTKLSVKNGANNCINPKIAQGDAFLVTVGYQGPSAALPSKLTKTQRQAALVIASALDRYNSGGDCT